ncbi:hypothetical protein ACUW9N_001355 [Staphylococcus auricularis]|nr:type I toxin-antitoxin system Fst family toxin [Staphylococcus auricularis]MBM0868274.1 type I toxin-antitoxin system Fst family toxin [Staphylococcus auricularis]MCG7340713.1 type I toxin-antitoxin system Fst family toxin [Staphylococcus auricularis]QPT06145.1 type I toxin-antitoxin system Fst family toxin [Staphylococcus auricularis]
MIDILSNIAITAISGCIVTWFAYWLSNRDKKQ